MTDRFRPHASRHTLVVSTCFSRHGQYYLPALLYRFRLWLMVVCCIAVAVNSTIPVTHWPGNVFVKQYSGQFFEKFRFSITAETGTRLKSGHLPDTIGFTMIP